MTLSGLAGKTVSPSTTVARGTPLHLAREGGAASKPVSYAGEVVPLLQKNCIPCHSPGNIGPFAMTSYEKVKSRGSMIEEVLLTQRMPPWHADRRSDLAPRASNRALEATG